MDFKEVLRLAQGLSAVLGGAESGCCGEKEGGRAESDHPPVARLYAAFREIRGGGGVTSKFVGDHALHVDFMEYDFTEETVLKAEADLRVLAKALASDRRRALDLVLALQAGRLAQAYAHMDALGISEPAFKATKGAGIGLLLLALLAVGVLVRSDTPIPPTPPEKELAEKKEKGSVEVSDDDKKTLGDLGIIK